MVADSEGDDDAPVPGEARDPALPDGLAPDQDPQQISEGDTYDSDRDVKITSAGVLCSGTLLRNDVVLTAYHCITDDGTPSGNVLGPGAFTVWQDGPGDTLPNATAVSSVVFDDPSVDVALLRLSGNFEIDNRSYGESTEIWAQPESLLAGEIALCQGYGQTTCGDASSAGFLRAGLVSILGGAGQYPNEELNYEATLDYKGDEIWGYLQSFGDSGSSCRYPLFAAPNRRRVLGVMSHGFPCTFGVASETAPNVFRSWVQQTIADWDGDFQDGFGGAFQPYEQIEPAPITTTPWSTMWFNYSYVQNGVTVSRLLQFYDDYVDAGDEEGTKYVHGVEVVEDGSVSVDVQTYGNDAVGLITRMRDDTHYYRFSVDEQQQRARIVLRDGNTFTELASVALPSADFNTEVELRFEAQGSTLRGYFDGQQVISTTDPAFTYMAGRAGIYTWRMSGVWFDNFAITR